MYKNIVSTIFWRDETKTFGIIKKLNCSLIHNIILIILQK